MMIVGVTGGIGSGKTTVCKIFELLGVPVFYADEQAKALYDEAAIKTKVARLVGKEVLDKNKKIDKAKLAEIAFSDKALLARLNNLIHPEVQKKFIAWKKSQKGAKMVIKEAAIMIESGSHRELDYLISITSPKDLKIKRIIARNNMSIIAIENRMKEQLSDKERAKYSDAVIVNDEEHSLIKQVIFQHRKLASN